MEFQRRARLLILSVQLTDIGQFDGKYEDLKLGRPVWSAFVAARKTRVEHLDGLSSDRHVEKAQSALFKDMFTGKSRSVNNTTSPV